METTKSFDAPEARLHFLDYWRIIRVRKTVILAVFLLVAITTTLVTFILPPTFASAARISVSKDASDIPGMGGGQAYNPFDPYWVQTEFEKIQSKAVLYSVITNLELNRKWGEKFKEGELRTDITYKLLKRSINVVQPRGTSLIEIKVLNDDATEASQIANAIAESYKQARIAKWRASSGEGLAKLEEEMAKHTANVTNLQFEVDELKIKLGITDVEAAQGGISPTLEPETLRKLEAERISAEGEYARMVTTFSALTNATRPELKRAIVNVITDSLFSRMLEELSMQETRFAALTNTLGFNNNDVRAIRDSIAVLNNQIDTRIDGILAGLKITLDSKKAALDKITEKVALAKTNDINTAIARRPYIQKKRDLENWQFLRERLYARILQEKVDASLPRLGIVDILDSAEPDYRPVKPNKFLNIALGVIVGLAIGIGLAFFIEYLDTSVKTIDDVERALQAPVLGVIPQNVGYLISEGPDSPHAEAYRVLRTNILFSLKDPKLNTITIVSGGAGEGKSTTIFNLATVFAQNGSRVLVVDSDLRRPSIHKILKVSNSIGLTNFLLKQNSLEEVIQTTPLATLDFLPSGKLPSSSMGVLSSAQMKELIRDLKRRYDYVFFDSPPIMGVSDASILSSEVDSVLQVIQYRRYPQPMTIRAKQMIEKVGGNLLGIVLNNINMASDENYYYYSGYYYDYYSKNEDSNPDKAGDDDKAARRDEEGVEIKPKY
jgi:capsular exopolysaccharide synthesis family protein